MSVLLGAGGCSLLLDFDKEVADAGPAGVDACAPACQGAGDAPATEEQRGDAPPPPFMGP